MTKPKSTADYVPNDAFTQEDWDEVSDNPDLTREELSQLKPAQDVLPPDLYAALVNRGGRPKAAVRKVPVTIRLDAPILEAFKATGRGWQSRMNDELAKVAKRLRKA